MSDTYDDENLKNSIESFQTMRVARKNFIKYSRIGREIQTPHPQWQGVYEGLN